MLRDHQQGRRRYALAGLALTAVLAFGGVVSTAAQQATPAATPAVEAPATPVAETPVTPAPTSIPSGPLMSMIPVSHGVASGDVTATSVVVWSRAGRGPATMHVEYGTDPTVAGSRRAETAAGAVTETTDYAATVKLDGLTPDTRYSYRVWFTGDGEDATQAPQDAVFGTFRTAPDAGTSRPLSFIVGGDLAGQQYCRRPDDGYHIFREMEVLGPDFFVANGDLIYADGACPIDGPVVGFSGWENIPGDFPSIANPAMDWTDAAAVKAVYDRHWAYNRADPYYQSFLASTPQYVQWDDHEVINDFGAPWETQNPGNADRAGYQNLVQAGRESLFSWNPMDRHPDEPNRIYRSYRWGAEADLFILDQRSYRSPNSLPDTPENTKSMLGAAQLDWLKQGLLTSTATWKIVSADVPISIPTGSNAVEFGRDGWASGTDPDFSSQTGFEREFLDLLRFIDDNDLQNVVFVVCDVHFAMNIGYEVDANGDGDAVVFHEFVNGPLNAVAVPPPGLDPTFNPTILYQEGDLFNFGYVRIEPAADGTYHLTADVRGEDGLPRPGSTVELAPAG